METHSARVVVGADGSPGGQSALVVALLEAARRGIGLEVVVACPLVEPWTVGPPLVIPDVAGILADGRARGLAYLEEARSAELLAAFPEVADVEADVVASELPPGQALVERSASFDLLVIGSRGRGAARSALLGSVALHCVTHARCPVLVVHGDPADVPDAARVVVGLCDSTVAREALRLAADEAGRLGAGLDVVMAYRPMDYYGDIYAVMAPPAGPNRAQIEARGHAIMREVLGDDGRESAAQLVIEEGDAGRVLVDRSANARLLVVGSECRSRLEGMVLGSVALRCVVHARCPVLVVHPQQSAVLHEPVTTA